MSLESFVKESEEVLHSEFGFKPEKSKFIFYNPDSWKNLLKWRNKNTKGFFLPRNLTAHILNESLEWILPILIHEYLGHGSYCESTQKGNKLVGYERKLFSVEEELIGKELPENARIGIIKSNDSTKLIESKESNYDYILQINPDNFLLKSYLSLKEKHKQFAEQNLFYYEGFAIWLEEFLLRKLNHEDIWNRRENELKQSNFYNLYQQFKDFEDRNGTLSLIYKVGFPKQFSEEFIKKAINKKIDLEKLKFLISYGSRKSYGDIDLVAVYEDNMNEKSYSIFTGDLDITQIKEEEFNRRLNLFDIELTEPILTGELVMGDQDKFSKLRRNLENKKPSQETIDYLTRKSLESYNTAVHYFNSGIYEAKQLILNEEMDSKEQSKQILEDIDLTSNQFEYTLIGLSYALSYKISSSLYSQSSKTLTLSRILENNNSPLNQIIEYIKSIRNKEELPKKNKTKKFLDKINQYLKNN